MILVLPQSYNVSFSILVKKYPVEAKDQFQVLIVFVSQISHFSVVLTTVPPIDCLCMRVTRNLRLLHSSVVESLAREL